MPHTSLDPFASATDMLAALRSRAISAEELLDLHLQRIERHNPTLNAIVTPDFDAARQAAVRADAERAAGGDRRLLGMPLTIKDCIDVAGLPGTAGVEQFRERCPEQDSLVAGRVRQAGAVIMGKTNVPPMAGDWQANNPIFGRTVNPWDHSRTPGGSTGGGSAALAAGLTPLEFGSDIGGSIRVPAAFCGVYGHRPSESAVPRSGHFPGSPLANPAFVMGVQGPLARAAEDLELALDVISGPEVGLEVAWRLELPPARQERLADFRVAVMPPVPFVPVDDEVLAAQERVAHAISQLGATVEHVQPELGDLAIYYGAYRTMLAVATSIEMPAEERRARAEADRETGDPFDIAWANGLDGSAQDFIRWHGMREGYRSAWRAFFREWDVLLAPIVIAPAFPHTDAPFEQRAVTVNGEPVRYDLQLFYPALSTLPGQPATAFPVGRSRGGLPIGLQAIGPYLEDRTPIRFAALIADEIGGFQPPPGYE